MHLPLAPNLFALLPLLCCAVAGAMAVLSLTRAPALAAMAVGVAVWCIVLAVVSSLTEPGPVLWLARVAFTCTVLVAGSMLIYLSGVARLGHRRVWIGACLAVSLPCAAMILFDPEVLETVRPVPWGGYYATGGAHVIVPMLTIGALLVAPLLATLRVYHRAPASRRRRQLAHVLVAYAIADVAAVDAMGGVGYDVPPIGWASFLLALGILYNAIAKVQLIDARTALARTRFWLLLLAATLLPLAGIWALTPAWPGWTSPLGRALALLLLFIYGSRIARGLHDLVYRRRRRLDDLVRGFTEETRAAGATADVAGALAAALRAGAGLELAAVALCVDVGDGPPSRFEVLGAATDAPAAPHAPLPDTPVARAELDPDAPALAWLHAYGAQVVVPLRHRGELAGVLLATARAPDLVLDDDTRGFLARLSLRAAAAFTSAALHGRLERHAAGLEREVRERTQSLEQAVTDVRAAQARLVQAERQSALGLLVAGVSHEVNNALNFIYANAPVLGRYAEVYGELFGRAALADDAAAGAAARLAARADAVTAAGLRARRLVEDLRRFARPEEVTPRAVDLREGLRATLQLLAPTLAGRIAVTQRIADAPPGAYVIHGFSAALHHALLALVLNAAQAIEGEGAIAVELAPLAGGVELAIRDSGSGIAAADLPRVFEPFFTTRTGASGLGLTASLQTAQRHGGTLEVSPGEGGLGTVVRLTLPAAPPAPAAGPEAAPPAAPRVA